MSRNKRKVLVGLSGGIDSSVAAFLLKKQGYDVIGIHLRFWSEPAKPGSTKTLRENRCCSIESWELAAEVAKKINIPFHVINFDRFFKKNIVDYYLGGIKSGLTPNPCIECNRKIKFGRFLEKMDKFGADYIATGHYVINKPVKKGGKVRYELHMAKDKAKDQSYFLYSLTQKKLAKILFPLGNYTKSQVRKLAVKFGLGNLNIKKESQNLCFIPENTPEPFLRRNIARSAFKPGPIITKDQAKIGIHEGLPKYTIGQRKGLKIGGISGKENEAGLPWYVIKKNTGNNTLIVGKENELYRKQLKANNLVFTNGVPDKMEMRIKAKIRYRSQCRFADMKIVKKRGEDPVAELKFDKGQRAVTPGQSVVFYKGTTVLGGGIIL